jgi:S1/P1 Nuclease
MLVPAIMAASRGLSMGVIRGITLTLSALAISSSPVWAWGMDGHRTVGMIADLILQNDPSGTAARQLLQNSLSEAAVWADCAKGACGPLTPDQRTYVEHNPQHKTFHYTDVPIQQPQYKLGTAGTRDDDVVQVAKQAINILRGVPPNQGPAVLDRKSALWVLAHMVGDLHQPLHVGAAYYDQECDEVVDPNIVGAGKPNFGIGSTVASTEGGNDLKLGSGARARQALRCAGHQRGHDA